MRLLKRSDFLYLVPALILLLVSAGGLARGGWLETMETVHTAPALNLKDLDGVSYRISDLKGKTVLVNFWTTWCPPCIEEMPSLIRLAAEMSQEEFVILAVNVEENKRRVSNIAKRLNVTFPVLLDPKREAGNAWKVKVFPSSFLVDAQGRLRHKAIGPVEWDSDEITSIVNQLIQE
ncbi:TlpA family protein disulfide reductase [Candidatus Thiodiazotropha sp. CDECU1]|uniref:TlpA family protein disulfide reductase n=1 Tax=Candidatus Thiodiazotropha sp. CDECU1 TaxID=3065865 RepID=UPI00292E56E2|nr:TlpA disulfide reductase family protein [Candidatus Thiodiazotropha sp. CDECU1]